MADCGEIGMMLGAFEDSELEPNEMQEVAFHLARCETCTGILADYSTLGRNLRSITDAPSLAGFSNAVIARVDRLPQPVLGRIEAVLARGRRECPMFYNFVAQGPPPPCLSDGLKRLTRSSVPEGTRGESCRPRVPAGWLRR